MPSRHHRYREEATDTDLQVTSRLTPSRIRRRTHLKEDVTLPVSIRIATRWVLNGRVRPGKDERLMPVVAAN